MSSGTHQHDAFDSIYRHGFFRAALCIPGVRVGEPSANVDRTIALAIEASANGARLMLFPELGLSSYSIDDLLHQDALLDAVRTGLTRIIKASAEIDGLILVGAPLRSDGRLYNCAVAIANGHPLGVVPKSYLPNYREFYEKRQFAPGSTAIDTSIEIDGKSVPFGSDVLFAANDIPGCIIHAEICEDLWAPIPPSTYAGLAGATILCNLSASNATIGKAEYRRDLCAAHSGRMIASYLYCAAGPGESTTDMAWDGHALAYENDELIAESERFADREQVVYADIDLDRLGQDRMRMTSFHDAVGTHHDRLITFRRVDVALRVPSEPVSLDRPIDRFPYVPNDPTARADRCFDAHEIQVQGLTTRLRATGIEKIVVGVSGGLDSTQALLVAVRAFARLSLPRTNILAYTLPGFATSKQTETNAGRLMDGLGVGNATISIDPLASQMLTEIGHPAADGIEQYDVTYENAQAGARTSLLFRLANFHGALVLGTGDLSELALGWTTYGVGDQMSHYNVNASVPKTLMQYLIRWTIESGEFGEKVNDVLADVLATAISPELVPSSYSTDEPGQSTEETIGPYELQDFHLYYLSRYGFRPSKVAWLAWNAWRNVERGAWPVGIADGARNQYSLGEIKRWLAIFVSRFFGSSQFKRTAMPNGPKVGSGGSLSPRGDWRAPSDSSAKVWLDELERNVPSV